MNEVRWQQRVALEDRPKIQDGRSARETRKVAHPDFMSLTTSSSNDIASLAQQHLSVNRFAATTG
eukprot:4753213-Pyramimonas_sp.AAC.1